MATNFSFVKTNKSQGGSVKFDKRSIKRSMSIQESTSLRMREEVNDLQRDANNISISDKEIETVISEFSSYPIFTIMNTKFGIVAYSILKSFNQFDEKEIGDKILELQTDIYKAFGASDETKKMKMKEDIMIYCRYINYMQNSLDDGESGAEESESGAEESEYDSD
jgi:hypothetical protein